MKDKIWGIGLHVRDDAARDRSNWRGENLLGEVLMEVRWRLRGAEGTWDVEPVNALTASTSTTSAAACSSSVDHDADAVEKQEIDTIPGLSDRITVGRWSNRLDRHRMFLQMSLAGES